MVFPEFRGMSSGLSPPGLRRQQTMPVRAPLPHIFIHPIRDFFGLLSAERRPRQRLPEIVEDEHLDLGLGGGILCPIVYGSEQLS